jgi:DNA-binding transcriptional ArsR family regulator
MQKMGYSEKTMPDIPRLKAEFFKALGHPLRIRVLELLSERERSVSELLEQVTVEQPYLSQQLAILRRADFVVTRREGTNVIYALADERIAELLAISRQMLLDMVTATRDDLRHA